MQNSLDQFPDNYAKWKKKKTLNWLHNVWLHLYNTFNWKIIETENRLMVARGEGESRVGS